MSPTCLLCGSVVIFLFLHFYKTYSHTLEHNSFGDGSLENTLAGTALCMIIHTFQFASILTYNACFSVCFRNNTQPTLLYLHVVLYLPFVFLTVEWYRVLRPGGLLMISVPNLHALAQYVILFLFSFPCAAAIVHVICDLLFALFSADSHAFYLLFCCLFDFALSQDVSGSHVLCSGPMDGHEDDLWRSKRCVRLPHGA